MMPHVVMKPQPDRRRKQGDQQSSPKRRLPAARVSIRIRKPQRKDRARALGHRSKSGRDARPSGRELRLPEVVFASQTKVPLYAVQQSCTSPSQFFPRSTYMEASESLRRALKGFKRFNARSCSRCDPSMLTWVCAHRALQEHILPHHQAVTPPASTVRFILSISVSAVNSRVADTVSGAIH